VLHQRADPPPCRRARLLDRLCRVERTGHGGLSCHVQTVTRRTDNGTNCQPQGSPWQCGKSGSDLLLASRRTHTQQPRYVAAWVPAGTVPWPEPQISGSTGCARKRGRLVSRQPWSPISSRRATRPNCRSSEDVTARRRPVPRRD
jgi:hypothetical protein